MNVVILFIHKVCFFVCALGLTYEVIKDQSGDALQCNSVVVISCKFAVNTAIIKWKIAPDVQSTTITAATCFSNMCVPDPSLAHNYSFTFDTQVGVSNLTIKKVTFEIQKLEFRCDDSVTFVPVKYNVTEPPSKQTIIISNTTNELRVETECVYPAENVIIKWYSRVTESSERIPHATSPPRRTLCDTTDDCILANKSATITSDLNLSQLTLPAANSVERNAITSSQMRIFEVEIIYDSGNFLFVLGNFSVQGTNKLVCDKSKCIPCWAFGVILEGIVCIAIIVVFIVHISGAFAKDTMQMNVLKGSLISIVVLAHIVVILAARLCKDESNCTDIICLPCWVYWVIQNGVIVATIACVILVNVLCDEVKTGFCYWTLYAIVGIATHVVIILAAEYCKMWDTIVEKRCLPCWVYGSILAGIILVVVVCAISIKACYPDGRIGGLWYWEMFALAGFFIVTIYLVFVVIFAGACKKNDDISDESFGCWAIYLVIFGIIVISVTCCMFIYVFIEPVRSAKVISRKVDCKGMSIRVLWESRLTDLKTYYIRLECKGKMLDPIELDHKYRQDGFLEYELTGLILDTDYQARLYSVVCKLPSLKNQITFDTKGRPMPPTKIYQDEQMRTEDSITLRWTAAKGPEHHFVIKYKRSKRQNSEWVNSKKVSSIWYTIDGLRPGTSYTIIVYAENTVGRSEESEPLFVKTRALKPVPPQQFKCTSSTENEVHLSWKPSKKLKNQQFLLTVYNNSGDGTKHEQETRIEYNGEQTMTHTVSQLNPGCKYQIEIFTSAGNVLSESSKIVNVETKGIRKEQLNDLKQTTTTTVFNLNNEK